MNDALHPSDSACRGKYVSKERQIVDLEANVTELEKVVEEWMKAYYELKDKYEPDILTTTESRSDGGVDE